MKYYVDINATPYGNGSKEKPFNHINDAAMIAIPGDEVIVLPGIYREYVNPINAGLEDKRIIYKSSEPLKAIITGAEVIKNWTKYQDNVWMVKINNKIFNDYSPYTTEIFGDWYFAPSVRHAGCVYLNDKMMYETDTVEECIKAEIYKQSWDQEFSIYKWHADVNNEETIIYANFQGLNPNEENVEINVRRRCFFPDKTGVNYITFSGFKVDKAATTWSPPAAFQDGMVGPHWSKGWIIEDSEISNSKCVGICLGKYYDPENDHYFSYKHIKSPTQMERDAVCRGQYHGWLKENIGHHIVRRCHIHHCEQGGIVGRMGAVFSTIEDNRIHHINNMQELGGAEIAGIKIHAAIDVIFRRNHIHHSTMGIWCDWEAQGTRITQNFLHDNTRPESSEWAMGGMESCDIFVEVGHGPTLIDNNVLLSNASLRISTEGLAMVHNLCLGSFTRVGNGTDNRYTPYHIRHRTEVAGFNIILHGDFRFYNNIFIQHYPILENPNRGNPQGIEQTVGTWHWDSYPTYEEWLKNFDMDVKRPDMKKLQPFHEDHLPVWIDGNAYFNGAKACIKEKNKLVNEKDHIDIELIEENGEYHLKTNLYDYLENIKDEIIDSDTLGLAYQPEERFENPDGTSITFDLDYFSNKRDENTIPGPFKSKEDLKKSLY